MEERIAVLAGTPVDTRMGMEILKQAGLSGLPFPLSPEPRAQTTFQLLSPAEKQRAAGQVLARAIGQGCGRAMVYCNSLSAAVDFPALAEEKGLPVVTPMDVYRRLGPRYARLGVLAANAQGLAGVERALFTANPALDLYGACALPAVLAVEAGEPPAELVERHRIPQLAEWFAACGAEALLLGCTHFPYFKAALARRIRIPVLDPAEEMLNLLSNTPRPFAASAME